MVSLHLPGEEVDDDPEPFVARVFGDAWGAGEEIIAGLLTAALVIGMVAAVVLPIGLLIFFSGRFIMRRR